MRALAALGMIAASGAMSGCSPSSPKLAALAKSAPAGVDIHCHVFNILDMPAWAFLIDVFIENPVVRTLAKEWARLVVEIASIKAPDFAKEKSALETHIANPTVPLPAVLTAQEIREVVAAGLWQYILDHTSLVKPVPPMDGDLLIQELVDLYLPNVDLSDPFSVLDAIPLFIQQLEGALAVNKSAPSLSAFSYIAQFLFYWAPELGKYRFQLADDCGALYTNKSVSVLLAPATLDIYNWLPDAPQGPLPTELAKQCELMVLISKIQPAKRVLHGFVGFDPWRHAMQKRNGAPLTAMKTVKDAIETQGFIGVKIYPPMGFRAIGNSALPNTKFPNITPDVPNKGTLLDDALVDLYTYCAANDVPIMAHCAPSQGPSPAASAQAHPQHWGSLLTMAEFNGLRVDLGHFGGVWAYNGTDPNWTNDVAALIQSGNFPFLFADFGDFANILGRSGDQADVILPRLKTLFTQNDKLASHVMYGTDFLLLGREPGFETFYDNSASRFPDAIVPANVAGLLGENAVAFLGLAPGQKNRVRLDAFYDANGMDKTKLIPIGG